jgi:hypothetical protein
VTLLFDTAADAQIPTLGASGAMAGRAGAPISCSISSRVLTLVLQYPRRDGPAPAVEEAVLRKCKLALIMGRGRACGRCSETGWRSCRRARRSGGS